MHTKTILDGLEPVTLSDGHCLGLHLVEPVAIQNHLKNVKINIENNYYT